jgi:hypothetical protein
VVAWLKPGLAARDVAGAAHAKGLDFTTLDQYSRRRLRRQGLVLGYGAVHERLIRDGCRLLAEAIDESRAR